MFRVLTPASPPPFIVSVVSCSCDEDELCQSIQYRVLTKFVLVPKSDVRSLVR